MKEAIRIVSIPPGEAPEWVRREWLGMIIPLSEDQSYVMLTGVRSGKIEQNQDVYSVSSGDAIYLLGKKSLDAAYWWIKNVPDIFILGRLAFNKEVCEIVSC